VFAESWAGNPKARILGSMDVGWKRLLVVQSSDPLLLGGEKHVRGD
jgi:hypothetical protein